MRSGTNLNSHAYPCCSAVESQSFPQYLHTFKPAFCLPDPRCKRSAFVGREEHDNAKVIACPLPGCRFLWCGVCQQQVPFEGPMHSCDGTSELDHLMKTKGWKYCPGTACFRIRLGCVLTEKTGCKTPIQKVMGCNHMTVSVRMKSARMLNPQAVHVTWMQHVSTIS